MTMTTRMNFGPHQYALLFPQSDNLDELVADIRANGLIQPIVLYQGKILDGWHRYQAALKANVEPIFEEYEGDDPLGYVASMNLSRRHLNQGQRALLRVKLADLRGELAPHGGNQANHQSDGLVTSEELAEEIGCSVATIERARRLQKQAPEYQNDVLLGTLTMAEAFTAARMKRMKDVVQSRPDHDWQQTPEIAEFVKSLQNVTPNTAFDSFRKAVEIGKLDPAGIPFVIKRTKRFLNQLAATTESAEQFVQYLEGLKESGNEPM